MRIPTSLADLLQGISPQAREEIASAWGVQVEGLSASPPEKAALYRLIDKLGTEERWTLFDIMDSGGYSLARLYPRRLGSDGARRSFDEAELTRVGLVFVVSLGAELERYYIVAEELRAHVHRYRTQLLQLRISALVDESNESAEPVDPVVLPDWIQPHFALSHLLASSDPEGFRFPLSRAFAIPDMFPVAVKRTLKKLLHEYYLLLLPCIGMLEGNRAHSIDTLVRLGTYVAALISHNYTPNLEPEYCKEDKRPFASPSVLLSGARKAFWRSFLVLFLDQFLTPIGATRTFDDHVQIVAAAFDEIDIEVKRSDWLKRALRDLGATPSRSSK